MTFNIARNDTEQEHQNLKRFCEGKVNEYVQYGRTDKASEMNEIIKELKRIDRGEQEETVEFLKEISKWADEKLSDEDLTISKRACYGDIEIEARMRLAMITDAEGVNREIPEHIRARREDWGDEYIK